MKNRQEIEKKIQELKWIIKDDIKPTSIRTIITNKIKELEWVLE